MAGTESVVPPATIQPTQSISVNNNDNTKPNDASNGKTSGGKKISGTKNSHGGKPGHKKRKRKNPENYDKWAPEDAATWLEVNQQLKQWKQTQRQCEPIISCMGRFKSIRQKMKPDEQYKTEKAKYDASLKIWNDKNPIPDNGTFDVEHD